MRSSLFDGVAFLMQAIFVIPLVTNRFRHQFFMEALKHSEEQEAIW